MELSPIGIIADIFWYEIRKYADFIKSGEFIVMPNHIHGILIVDKSDNDGTTDMVVNPNTVTVTVNTAAATAATVVETRHALSLQNPNQYHRHQQQWQHQQSTQSQSLSQPSTQLITKPQSNPPPQTRGQKRFQNQGKNTISSVIGGYKSAVTNHAHRLGHYFQWQPRFYDHIIKNNDEYQRIAKYIINNPVNWQNDKFNTV
jgi:REP element-mobilizing transposase RayT